MKRFVRRICKIANRIKEKGQLLCHFVQNKIRDFGEWICDNQVFSVILAISVLCGIAIGVCIFNIVDVTPATVLDYRPLEEQAEFVQENPELLWKTDCSITVKSEVITVTFSNVECKVIAKYDKDFHIQSTIKQDNSVHWLMVLIVAIAPSVLATFVVVIVILFLLAVILELWNWIKAKIWKSNNG